MESSSSSSSYSTNNRYSNFPPLMNDGRTIISSHQPEPVMKKKIMNDNQLTTNWEYRQYLIKNGENIIHQNFIDYSNDMGYVKRHHDIQFSNKPYKYESIMDDKEVFGVETTDLKDLYLSREQLESRKMAPTITQEQLLYFR